MFVTPNHEFLEFSISLYQDLIFGVKCKRIKKTWYLQCYPPVTITILGVFVNLLFCEKCEEKAQTKFITFIKRWLCYISVIEIWIFHYQDTLETKTKS